MQHNFIPALILIAGAVVALHYITISKTTGCPIVIAEGMSQTGKSTALLIALGLIGMPYRLISYFVNLIMMQVSQEMLFMRSSLTVFYCKEHQCLLYHSVLMIRMKNRPRGVTSVTF